MFTLCASIGTILKNENDYSAISLDNYEQCQYHNMLLLRAQSVKAWLPFIGELLSITVTLQRAEREMDLFLSWHKKESPKFV